MELLGIVIPGIDQTAVRAVLNTWGPGKFDAEMILDGKTVNPERMAPRQRPFCPRFSALPV